MNYQNSRAILGTKTVLPNFRDLIVNGLPIHFNAKNLQPVAKQPIFIWNFTDFMLAKDADGTIDDVHAYIKDKDICNLAPFNDFFLVYPSTDVVTISRVIKNKDHLTLYNFIYGLASGEWVTSGVYTLDSKNTFRFDPQWGRTSRGKELFPLLKGSESKTTATKITTFLYALTNYEREVVESTLSLKAKPSLRRKEWTGTVTETLITLKPKRVTYVGGKDKDPDHVPAPRMEHERMAHLRHYKSGKVVRIEATTINKGSAKGRKNATYKLEHA